MGWRAWAWVVVLGSASACVPNTSGIGGDSATPDPTTSGADASSTGPAATSTSGSDDAPGPASTSAAASTSTGDAPTPDSTTTTASVDTADTEPPPTKIEVCNSEDRPIPDNDDIGISSPIEILDEGTIIELRVVVQVTHTYVGDLGFELIQGAGMVLMVDNPGDAACTGDDIDVVLRDDAALTVDEACTSGTPALTGHVQPESLLGPVFVGEPMQGVWRLRAIDNNGMDTGTLTEWCLQITYE